jgi:tRNA threonylcarbamoyl adenosine modification protein YeaZ
LYFLILDTSTDQCLIALAKENQIMAEKIFTHDNLLSNRLLTSIQSLIENHIQSPKNLSGIAFGIGPGSYTGTRLGAAVAKGLAFGLHIPIKTFSSPLAFLPNKKGTFAFLMPAKSSQFYVLSGTISPTYVYPEGVAKLRFGAKPALFAQGPVFAQIAYSKSSMSICAETGPAQKSSNLASKASFAIPSPNTDFSSVLSVKQEEASLFNAEEIKKFETVDFFVCSSPEKLPVLFRKKSCYPAIPNLQLLCYFLSSHEPVSLENAKLLYLHTP